MSDFNEAVIVLGCGIDAAGALNPDAEGSVRIASELYSKNPQQAIIMTGYVSYKADFMPSISEAQAMKDFAVSIGLPITAIFVEAESKDSIGNLYFTKTNFLMPLNITEVKVVRGPNQTTERIAYICQKVLGQDYQFEVIEPDVKRPQEAEREQRSLAIAKQWGEGISDGDHEAIYRLMRERHPGYNSAVPLSSLTDLL